MARCICCDASEARWWKDNYYCSPCLQAIKDIIREDRWMDKQYGRSKTDDSR